MVAPPVGAVQFTVKVELETLAYVGVPGILGTVVPDPVAPCDVSMESPFLALTVKVYWLFAARFFTTIVSRVASDIQTTVDVAAPVESTHLPSQLESVGEVEVTWTAKVVFEGLPFWLFVIASVEVVGLPSVGAEGVAAYVYADEVAVEVV